MSMLETPHHHPGAIPHFVAADSTQANFWPAGPSAELPLLDSPTAAEALSLSLLLAIRPEWTERRQTAEVESSQGQATAGRKRKMSSQEGFPSQEQKPKRLRDIGSLEQPQYVAPHELTASSGPTHSYTPPGEQSESRTMRPHGSAVTSYEQARPIEAGPQYHSASYLQPSESEWSSSMPRERRVLPSISTSPVYSSSSPHGGRMSASYSMSSLPQGYTPTGYSQVQYSRAEEYSYGRGSYDSQAQQQHGGSQQALMHSGDPQVRQVQSQLEQDPKGKPRCWEHGCAGRQFSTFSNLLRHQRERAGQIVKSTCPRCGAEFTRKTARDGHFAHGKCKGVRRSPDPSQGSGSGHDSSPFSGSQAPMSSH